MGDSGEGLEVEFVFGAVACEALTWRERFMMIGYRRCMVIAYEESERPVRLDGGNGAGADADAGVVHV